MSLETRKILDDIRFFYGKDPDINFIGLTPGEKTNELIQQIIDRLQRQAPSDARLKFSLEKEGELYFASCKITAKYLSIVLKAHGYTPLQTMQQLERKTKTQLDLWKRKRAI